MPPVLYGGYAVTKTIKYYEIELLYVTKQRDVQCRKVLHETRSSLVETLTLRLIIIKLYHHKAVCTRCNQREHPYTVECPPRPVADPGFPVGGRGPIMGAYTQHAP